MELGLWSTIAIMLGFSALVIIMDEIIHARRRKAKGKTAYCRAGIRHPACLLAARLADAV